MAALLPNLASVRRPSKSAIVNSSIALIHSQRRARAIAGHELRQLKAETDALRRELNEWRDRTHSGPRIEEPARSAEFISLINLHEDVEQGEEERRAYAMRDAEDAEEDMGDLDEEDMGRARIQFAPTTAPASLPIPIPSSAAPQQAPRFDYSPMDASHEKMAAWNAHIYNAFAQSQWASQQAQQVQAHQQAQIHAQAQAHAQQAAAAQAAAMFTPPASSHGLVSSPSSYLSPFAHVASSRSDASPVSGMFPGYPSAPPTSAHSNSSSGLQDDDGSSVGSYHDAHTPPPHSARGTPPQSAVNVFAPSSPFGHEVTGSAATSAEAFAAAFHNYPRHGAGMVNMSWGSPQKGGGSVGVNTLAAMGLLM